VLEELGWKLVFPNEACCKIANETRVTVPRYKKNHGSACATVPPARHQDAVGPGTASSRPCGRNHRTVHFTDEPLDEPAQRTLVPADEHPGKDKAPEQHHRPGDLQILIDG